MSAPELATAGRELLYAFAVPLGYLATIRKDGGLRIHPVCPFIAEGKLWVFVLEGSPKRHDLLRDGRYALHAFPLKDRDDEFFLAGRADHVATPAVVERMENTLHDLGVTSSDHTLFELRIERALYARYRPHAEGGGFPPEYLRWQSSAASAS